LRLTFAENFNFTDMKKLVVLTGAGMSAESGIPTYRDAEGLWKTVNQEDVASIEAWERNPASVLDFFNTLRKNYSAAKPNEGHRLIAELENFFEVTIITQNIDSMHEQAGSSQVLHLHGELSKVCNESKTEVWDIGAKKVKLGDKASDGTQVRPFIVLFGEAVPEADRAVDLVEVADILLVIGTSLTVLPAAALVEFRRPRAPFFLINPEPVSYKGKFFQIEKTASEGMKYFYEIALSKLL
jgi:NAD-dependent deacetylase